ncbi:MAG: nitrogen regulation protein NR(I) [Pseudomonadales bacterium]
MNTSTLINKDSELVWVVDDDKSIRWVLEKSLQADGIQTESFSEGTTILHRLSRERPAAIISDIRMPGIDGLELLAEISAAYPELPVIITTAHSDLESAVASYKGGAFEYLPKPFDVDDAVAVTRRALAHSREQRNFVPAIPDYQETEISGEAPAMQEVFRAIGRLSRSHMTVLINGESGTGKELVAQALHNHSPRSTQPFIALNMAAIPKDLMESELFGHEKGAFTGATAQRVGRFEQANGGTLFLDEIGDMPSDTQTRLLRVLADGQFYRVGGHTPVSVDVRIIAATHQKLEQLVSERSFREDLFHRLNVIRVHLPPLRERREDIPKLMNHFFQLAAEELNVERKVLTTECEQALCNLAWQGNVRQLENTCRWLTVMASGREVLLSDLPPELKTGSSEADTENEQWPKLLRRWADQQLQSGKSQILDQAVPDFERVMIEAALHYTQGRRRDASEVLGWGRNTLTRKINELGMDSDEQ